MTSVNETLLSRYVRHHVGVLRLAARTVDDVSAALDESEQEIVDLIKSAAPATNSKVDQLLVKVHSINQKSYDGVEELLTARLNELAQYEVEHGADLIDEAMPVRWQLATPKRKFVRAIVEEEPMQGGYLSEWVAGMADGRFTRIRQAVRIGVTAQDRPDQLVARVQGRKSLNYRDAAIAPSRRSAISVTNTLFNHVSNRAKLTLYRANDDLIEGSIWTAVLDDATCPECADLDGTYWPNGDEPDCPAHLSCRCDLVPVISSWQRLGIGDELTDAQKQQLDGVRPGKLRFNDWLKAQDQSTQEEVLGVERAAMFRRGFSLSKFYDTTGRRYTLPELRSLEAKRLAPRSELKVPKFVKNTVAQRKFGYVPDLPDFRDMLFGVEHPEELATPVRVSLRDQMPPVFNQGALGSCTANAIVAAAMFAFGEKTPMLSRLDLYYKSRVLEGTVDEDVGASLRDGIKALAKWGVCTEELWKYRIRDFRGPPPKGEDEEDDQYKIKSYQRLKSHDDFMKCLAMGYPFVGGFSVYQNFDGAMVVKNGVLQMPTVDQKMLGGHAVCIVGYDSKFHDSTIFKNAGLDANDVPDLMYEVRNSFGADWGLAGHYWMPGTYLENRDLSDDFWMIRA